MNNFSANYDKILETIKQIESKMNYLSQMRKPRLSDIELGLNPAPAKPTSKIKEIEKTSDEKVEYSVVLKDAPQKASSKDRSVRGSNPEGYKVWRLLNGQEQNESQWVLITNTPITTLTCDDTDWAFLPDKAYRYAVRSVYSNDVMSIPTFSNAVDKGKYAVVTVNVTAQAGTPEGAAVTLSNDGGKDRVFILIFVYC